MKRETNIGYKGAWAAWDYIAMGLSVILILVFIVFVGWLVCTVESELEPVGMKSIGSQHLTYDEDTKIMYYKSTYIMSPYYSENGKMCRYVDGEIIEVDDGR